MSLRKKVEEEDYYCLVQCDCGRKHKPEEMFLCYFCSKIKCNFCLITEATIFRCPGFCPADSTPVKNEKNCCNECLECPLCFTPLITRNFNKKYYLFCTSCYWNSQNVHISKENIEDLKKYLIYLNQEQNSGFFRGMYDNILKQLSQDDLFAGEIEKDSINEKMMKFSSEYDTVQKAMEKGEQTFEEFDKRIKEDINNDEKKAFDKYEYNDDYLNKEENKENKNFKLKNRLLHCYNDYTQNFNSLDEVKKAFNTNALSLNVMTSLEQRHNNVSFQNNSIFNQYPKFIDLIPKQKDFSKKCKECRNTIVKIPGKNSVDNDGIIQSYISLLPVIMINKIDWEQNSITLRFVLVNFINVTISFKEDKLNDIKIKLPEGQFVIDEPKTHAKKILINFKFDENIVKNKIYFFRFILKAEFKRNDVGELSFIEYPVEIKFK